MRQPNWRSMGAAWRRLRREGGLLSGVQVEERDDGSTWVEVDHSVPHIALRGRHRYLFTTKQRFLDPAGFPDQTLRQNIAQDAQKPRRRALYCWDIRRGLTLAALSFHVDRKRSIPLIVTDLGIREDELRAHSLFAGGMLLDVLQDIAVAAPNRVDGEVGALAEASGSATLLRELGLRPCPRPPQLSKPGIWYCYPRRR